jgi:hypothetical protein
VSAKRVRRHDLPYHFADLKGQTTHSPSPKAQAVIAAAIPRQLHAVLTTTLIMGIPACRLTNPIARCRDQPHYGYAGTDDGRGTDHGLTQNASR